VLWNPSLGLTVAKARFVRKGSFREDFRRFNSYVLGKCTCYIKGTLDLFVIIEEGNKPPLGRLGLPSMVAVSASAVAADNNPPPLLPRYPLHSNSQSKLLLRSPLCSPHRINLVPETTKDVSPSMAAPLAHNPNPMAIDAKLDRILGQLATLNTRMDSHNKCIACTEKF